MTARELYDAAVRTADLAATHGGSSNADSMYRHAAVLAQIEAAEALTRIADALEQIVRYGIAQESQR